MKKIISALIVGVLVSQNGTSQEIEDKYNIPADYPIIRPNFVILSGCSGGGKSTLLSEMAKRGYDFVPEPGRQIVKEQEAIHGDGLPWKNLGKFLDLALSRYIHQFMITEESKKFVFFDRGIADAIDLNDKGNQHFWNAANKFRYNQKVFLVPPWEEIYKNDSERKHSFQEAIKEYESLLIKYKKLDYEVVIIPQDSVQNRVDFIISNLTKAPDKSRL